MADIKEELAAAKAEVVELQTEKEALLTNNEALSAKVEDLEKKVETFSNQNGSSVVVDAPPEKIELPAEDFTVDKVKYVFAIAIFRHNNQVITAKSALQMPEILKELVEMKSAVVKRKGE